MTIAMLAPFVVLYLIGAFAFQYFLVRGSERRRAEKRVARMAVSAPIRYEIWLAERKKEVLVEDARKLSERIFAKEEHLAEVRAKVEAA